SDAAAVGADHSMLRRYTARFNGADRDRIRLDALKETFKYRPKLGAALLAQWELEGLDPEMTAAFHREAAQVGVSPSDFVLLQFLLRPDENSIPHCVAIPRLTELFEAYYNHAAPFSRAALKLSLDGCSKDTSARTALEKFLSRSGMN